MDLPPQIEGLDVKNMTLEQAVQASPRFASNERYLNVIQYIRTLCNSQGKTAQFHIVSDGKPEHFDCFKADDIELHLKESVEQSYCRLVYADVLVICHSAFSYTAGLLRPNNVFFQPFVHAPVSSWIAY
jgi:hypothetical protein